MHFALSFFGVEFAIECISLSFPDPTAWGVALRGRGEMKRMGETPRYTFSNTAPRPCIQGISLFWHLSGK